MGCQISKKSLSQENESNKNGENSQKNSKYNIQIQILTSKSIEEEDTKASTKIITKSDNSVLNKSELKIKGRGKSVQFPQKEVSESIEAEYKMISKMTREDCNQLKLPRSASKSAKVKRMQEINSNKKQQQNQVQQQVQIKQQQQQQQTITSEGNINYDSETQENKSQNINYSSTIYNNLEFYNQSLNKLEQQPQN